AVRGRRPILAAPQARTELGALVGARLARLIDLGPSGPGIEPLEHVLAHVGLAGDELDLAVGALELPEIAVARDVDEALHASPVAPVVDDQRRRDFVPIPGVVRMILEVSLDLPGAGVEGDDRGGEQIVAGTLIAEPWAAVAGAPESQIGLGVIGTRDPDRRAAPLMMVAARGPGLAAGLTRGWHRIGLPELLAGLRIEGREEAAHAQFTARCAEQHLAVDDERRERQVVAFFVVIDFGGPGFLAGPGVDRDQHRFRCREIDLVAVKPHAAAGRVQRGHVFGERAFVAPQQLSGPRLQREQLVAGRRDEHASHENAGHHISSSFFPSKHQLETMPTRPVNGFATASLPSTILSGSAARARGAGPSMTDAPSRGL